VRVVAESASAFVAKRSPDARDLHDQESAKHSRDLSRPEMKAITGTPERVTGPRFSVHHE
jgi:hypothetical protein